MDGEGLENKPALIEGSSTYTSDKFLNRLLLIANKFPVETMMTAVAIGQMVGAGISFASGNKDAAFTRALAATITQVATSGILATDIAIRKHF